MKNQQSFLTIFWRELFSYFNSPIAYIFIVVFVLLMSSLFMSNFFLSGQADMRSFFNLIPFALCVFIPAITMRSWSEEKRGNTFELLMTFPMNSYQLVLGKFFAAFKFYKLSLIGTFPIPWMIASVGDPDWGMIIGGYIGAVLLGAFFLSIGIFISSLCRDQIVSFVLSMVVCFVFYLVGLDLIAASIDGWVGGAGSFLRTHISVAGHYFSFAKGVIDSKDILYFLVMITVFLMLNIFAIEDRMRSKAKLFLSGAVIAGLVFSSLFNVLVFDLPLGRFDLTEAKLYTITDASKRILKTIDAPVSLKLYISPRDKMPTQFQTLEQQLKDKLEELTFHADGKINFQVVYMEARDEKLETEEETVEKKVQRQGVKPFHVQSINQDEMDIKLIYSSIGIAYKEQPEDVLPQAVPQILPSLEFDVVSRIYRMIREKQPTVAIVAPYSEKKLDPQVIEMLRQFGQVPEQLREDYFQVTEQLLRIEEYKVHRIKLTKEEPIPEGVDTLVIIDPTELNDRQKYEISKFLYEGGNVFLAAQEFEYEYQHQGRGVSLIPKRKKHRLYNFLEEYGLRLNHQFLFDHNHEVINVRNPQAAPFVPKTPIKAPIQIVIKQETMNKDVSITGHLSSMIYMWGSALDIKEEKLTELDLERTDLFTSGEKSWLRNFYSGSLKAEDLTNEEQVYSGKQSLAVLLQGQFPDVYADKEIPDWPEDRKNQEQVDGEKDVAEEVVELKPEPGQLIVVGCSKMFEDSFIKHGGSAKFFMNAIDSITLGSDLIHIRSHQAIDRRIEKLSKSDRLFYRFMTVFFVPLLVVSVGGGRALMRAKEKEQYLHQVKGDS